MQAWKIRIEGESRPDRLEAVARLAGRAVAGDTPLGPEEARDIAARLEAALSAFPQYEDVRVSFDPCDAGAGAGNGPAGAWGRRVRSLASRVACSRALPGRVRESLEARLRGSGPPTLSIALSPRKEATKCRLFAGASARSPVVEAELSRANFKALPGFASGAVALALEADSAPRGGQAGAGGNGSENKSSGRPAFSLSAFVSQHLLGSRYNARAGVSVSSDRIRGTPVELRKQEVCMGMRDVWPGLNNAGLQGLEFGVSAGRQQLRAPGLRDSLPGDGAGSRGGAPAGSAAAGQTGETGQEGRESGPDGDFLDSCVQSCFRLAFNQSLWARHDVPLRKRGEAPPYVREGPQLATRWSAGATETLSYAPGTHTPFGTLALRAGVDSGVPLARNARLSLAAEASALLTTLRGAVVLQDRLEPREVPGFFGRLPGRGAAHGAVRGAGEELYAHARLKLEVYAVRELMSMFPGAVGRLEAKNPGGWAPAVIRALSSTFLVAGADAAGVGGLAALKGSAEGGNASEDGNGGPPAPAGALAAASGHAELLSSLWAGTGVHLGGNTYILAAGLPLAGRPGAGRAFGLLIETQ